MENFKNKKERQAPNEKVTGKGILRYFDKNLVAHNEQDMKLYNC